MILCLLIIGKICKAPEIPSPYRICLSPKICLVLKFETLIFAEALIQIQIPKYIFVELYCLDFQCVKLKARAHTAQTHHIHTTTKCKEHFTNEIGH